MSGWVIGDKVAAYTLTNGTGAYTTEATTPTGGWQHLNTVLANTGDYAIVRTESGSDFEVAVLTKTGSHTFARTEVIESTNADAAVSWPVGATMTMALVVPADEFKGYEKEDYIINGNGQVQQIALGSTADDVYSHDQWYALTQTAALTTSQLTDVEDGVPNMIRLTQGQASAQRIGYAQILEGARCKKLRGKRVTFGGRLRYSNAAAVRFAILEWTGTVDVVTSDVVNDWTNSTFTAGNFFNSTTLTVRAVGTLTPSAATLTDWRVSAMLGSSFNNLIVMIWTEGTAAQNSTLDFVAQFKRGFVVAPYAFRGHAEELFLCQRYLERLGPGLIGYADGTTTIWMGGVFKVTKRIAPTMTGLTAAPDIRGVTIGYTSGSGSVFTFGALIANGAGAFGVQITGFTGLTNGVGVISNTAALVQADARL